MYKFYASIAAMMILVHCAFAQSPTISINPSGYNLSFCTDALYKLPVTIKGLFSADNKFSIQVRYDFGNVVIITVPAVLNNGNLEFTIGNPTLFTNNRSIRLKAVASAPSVESGWMSSSIYAYTKGTISLGSLAVSDTVNLYDNIRLQLKGATNSDILLTLSDSTKLNITYPSNGIFTESHTYPVTKAGTFTIAHAENGCGAMQTSGSFNSVVNPTSLITTQVAPKEVCENGEVKISFSTQGIPLTAQTKYKIRFVQLNSPDTKQATVEVQAQLTGNFLIAKFPPGFELAYTRTDFAAQVVTENPSLVGSIGSSGFGVSPQPSAVFTSSNQLINLGDSPSLQLQINGLPPFTIELSDGTKQNFSSLGSTSIIVRPFENTSYSIKSMESGCGKSNLHNTQTVNISVRPGIYIEDGGKPQIICAGSKGRIRFRSSASLTAATQFTISALIGNERVSFPAVRSGEYLEFEVPNRPQGYQQFYCKIITSNPSFESQSINAITVQTLPSLSFSPNNKYNYQMPGMVDFYASLYGGSPFLIENMDGSTNRIQGTGYTTEFYLKETQQYKIRSLSNSCFKNENLPSATFTLVLAESPGIYIEPAKRLVCDTDSLEITFGTVGKFNPDNIFSINGSSTCCNSRTLSTVRQGGKYKIKLPATQFPAVGTISVKSSSPVVYSEQVNIGIQRPLIMTNLYPEGKQEEPVRYIANLNSAFNLSIQTSNNDPTSSVTYTENGADQTYINSDLTATKIPIAPSLGTIKEYSIKSVSNECGTYRVNASTFVILMPYDIIFSPQYHGYNYCVGAPISIPFGITDGTYTNATFSLQIRNADSTKYTTLVSGETSRILKATIPTSMKEGNYVIRIISSDGAMSHGDNIQIGRLLTGTLSVKGQSTATINSGDNVSMDVTISGGNYDPAAVIFEDGSKKYYYEEKGNRSIYPQKSGEYSIKSISNVCGYGTATGSVKVVVKPRLTASSDSYGICEGGSLPVTYTLGGDADLSDDYIRFELFDTSNNTTTVLDSTKTFSGIRLLKLPAVLKGSNYQIRVTVRKYQQTANVYTSITTKPDASLSGSTVINSGESTRLTIKANKSSNGDYQYVLSDGTKGSFWGQIENYTYITVSPKQTTTYTISSLINSCGEGAKSGSAIVEVNPAADRTVTVTGLSNAAQWALCTGDTVSISYLTKGSFSAGNQMTVQVSDTTGRNFRSITTIGNASPIKAVLPTDLISTKFYRVRIIASDPNTGSGAYEYPITASQKAKARFESDFVTYEANSNPRIVVLLEGGAPWTFEYGPDGSRVSRYTSNAIEKIELSQASPNQYYKLFSVRNNCGFGSIGTPSTVRVELITGLEPASDIVNATVAPNPAQEILKVTFKEPGERNIKLYDVKGSELIQKKSRMTEENIDIRSFSTGIYILQIEAKGKRQSFKVIKN